MGKNKSIFFFILSVFLLLSPKAYSQYVIQGKVLDAETLEPVEFATVFINYSTFGDISDSEGHFSINIPPGDHELVISFMGYQTFKYDFSTQFLMQSYEFRILPEPIDLKETEVTIKRDRTWYRNLDVFKVHFLGQSINAERCKILNPEVLVLDAESEKGKLKARARETVLIENPNLGYTIQYVLEGFELDLESGISRFAGYPYFIEADVPRRRERSLHKNRERAYNGSIAHFIRSLYLGIVEEEGYEMYTIDRIPNLEVISEELAELAQETLIKSLNPLVRDSLKNIIRRKDLPKEIEQVTETRLTGEGLVEVSKNGLTFLTYDKPFYLIYKEEMEEMAFIKRLINKDTQILTGRVAVETNISNSPQRSSIRMLGNAVRLFENGSYFHPFDLMIEGYMAWEKVGDLMPFNYSLNP
ncbi:carboxypeptidase-like regulatory domain-containing protein [Mongoliitalea daihaiensis]|uniref:carboxypeptidase-like regulatory domain-containing protein n=1 Tax=Mongoliitalea daihaiensis TaxID=2782006 RepID=UPI001F42CC0D|nr:carboxypeptidase-like regulatory domain-containing protein [Mongoliitalea daihaiensis]UJP66316.1 carboxypeptidase-like regulatory domain-containing protein [Mongoliitalea daihaiensis]